MKRLMEVLEKTLTHRLHPVEAFKFLSSSLRAFIIHGAVSIETLFAHHASGEMKTYRFRTTIQLDGDVISVVPGLNPGDPDWQEAFQKAYRIHQEKLKLFVSQLDGTRSIAWMMGALVSSLLLVSSWKVGLSGSWGYASGGVYLILWPALTYFMRRHAVRVIIWISIKIAVWRARKRLTKAMHSWPTISG